MRILEEIILQAGEAFEKWKKSDFDYRKSLMVKAASLLRSKVKYRIITSEMGKPLKESEIEVDKCAWACDYYAENAPEFLKKEPVETDADISYVSYEPLGPILGIMPWNFPFWQVFRFAVPTIMAGNTVLLKHASNVHSAPARLRRFFMKLAFPPLSSKLLLQGLQKWKR